MEEAKASWNSIYESKEGFECQITIRDEDENNVARRAARVIVGITKSGGKPVKRWNRSFQENQDKERPNPDSGRAYVDRHGAKRCSMKLKNGKICNFRVEEKEGRYGKFWRCPNYRNHA